MKVRILASGSGGNATIIEDTILIDAGITLKAFNALNIEGIETIIITHHHDDHMQKPLIRDLIKRGITTYLPKLAIAELMKEGRIDLTPLIGEQVFVLNENSTFECIPNMDVSAHPQKHHDIANYALVMERSDHRLLYATDLDTLSPSDLGVGLLHLGTFDTILLEGNYDEVYLREYIEYMVSLVPGSTPPSEWTDDELDKWVRLNYRHLPDNVRADAFRAIQNHRHLSKQQSRAYAATYLNPGGRYFELHRSKRFYQAPDDWYTEDLNIED